MTENPTRKFFLRDALCVSKNLLGKYLVRKWRNKIYAGMIVETEAYTGIRDKASHAYGGKITPRNMSEYLQGGHIYIYLCYGMYWQLNITVKEEGIPECVLIRALEPAGYGKEEKIGDLDRFRKMAAGPGRLCRWLHLNKSFNSEDITRSRRIWIEDRGVVVKKPRITSAKRIGIDYAEEWAEKPYRFYIKSNPFVSR